MSDSGHPCVLYGVWYATEWQRRMFLAPEQEVPEALKDLLIEDENYVPPQTVDTSKGMWLRTFNQIVIEAYRRGQKNSV